MCVYFDFYTLQDNYEGGVIGLIFYKRSSYKIPFSHSPYHKLVVWVMYQLREMEWGNTEEHYFISLGDMDFMWFSWTPCRVYIAELVYFQVPNRHL